MSALSDRYPDPDTVYAVLVEEAGADPEQIDSFRYHWPDCREYRFMGRLGAGGKVWANRGKVYVTCYPEDENAARHEIVEATNKRLADL